MNQLIKDCTTGVSVEAASLATSALFEFNNGSGFLPPAQQKQFHSLVAKIRYLAENIRPDLNFVVAISSYNARLPT